MGSDERLIDIALFSYLIFVIFLHNPNLRPTNFTLKSAKIWDKNVCKILHCAQIGNFYIKFFWLWQISGVITLCLTLMTKAQCLGNIYQHHDDVCMFHIRCTHVQPHHEFFEGMNLANPGMNCSTPYCGSRINESSEGCHVKLYEFLNIQRSIDKRTTLILLGTEGQTDRPLRVCQKRFQSIQKDTMIHWNEMLRIYPHDYKKYIATNKF